jgi:hypothetical protein
VISRVCDTRVHEVCAGVRCSCACHCGPAVFSVLVGMGEPIIVARHETPAVFRAVSPPGCVRSRHHPAVYRRNARTYGLVRVERDELHAWITRMCSPRLARRLRLM